MVKGKKKNIKFHIVTVLLIAIIIGILFLMEWLFTEEPGYDEVLINDGWTVRYNDEVIVTDNITELFFGNVKKGAVLEAERKLPECYEVEAPTLSFYSIHSKVEVYLDDELYYEYGEPYYSQGRMLGYGFHYIVLPKETEGKNLKILYRMSEDNSFSNYYNIKIVDGYRIQNHQLNQSKFSLFTSLFLIVCGLLLFCVIIVTGGQKNLVMEIICIAALSTSIGLWTMCNRNIYNLLTDNLRNKVFIEYLSLYMITIPFLGYFVRIVSAPTTPKPIKFAYRTILWGQIAFYICVVLLAAFNVVHLPVFLPIVHGFMVLTIVIMLVFAIDKIRRKERVNFVIIAGFTAATVLAGIDLIRYNLSKYLIGFKGDAVGNSYIDFSAILIVVTLFLDFFKRFSDIARKESRDNILAELAYLDELTGLANRRKCDDSIKEMIEKKVPFILYSFDLNLLKKVNDSYGHEEGDKLINSFADALRRAFPADAIIARYGGDEFTVILSATDGTGAEEGISRLMSEIEAANKNNSGEKWQISTAAGFAYSSERETPHDLFVLADERMYNNKRESKLGRQ